MAGGALAAERRGFAADHYHSLPGFCEPRHGHRWEAEAAVGWEGRGRLGPLLDDWAAAMDRSLLNGLAALAGRNPTAEALAECLFRHLEESGLRPAVAMVRERARCWASCRRRGPA